jgi:hypothetical protein
MTIGNIIGWAVLGFVLIINIALFSLAPYLASYDALLSIVLLVFDLSGLYIAYSWFRKGTPRSF